VKFRTRQVDIQEKLQLRMAPMIDVVFLLLIFFMCATRWKTAEGNLPTNLPKGISESIQRPPAEMDIDYILIKIMSEDGGVRILVNETKCAGFAQVEKELETLRRKVDVPVIIDADRDVLFQNIVSALNAALRANFKDISFAAPIPSG